MAGGMGKIFYCKKASGMIRPFYAKLKKHYCQKCGNRLKLSKITQRINKGSFEAQGKYLPFDSFNHPIDYTFSIFVCDICKKELSIDDQYHIENPHKNKRFEFDDYHQYLQSLDRQNGTNQYAEYVKNLEMQNKQKTRNR